MASFCFFTVGAEELTNYKIEIKNDTLYVISDSLPLPSNVVVVCNDEPNIYQKLFNDPTDDLMENHPAADLYNNVWTRERLNPYKIPIDSIPDSVRRYRYHYGTDVKVYTGDTISCAFDGMIRIIDYEPKGYGHYIVVRHDNGLETVYAHLSRVLVHENQRVHCGEPIGLGGNTGRSTGSHLHFEIRFLGNALNPQLLIDFENNQIKTNEYVITKRNTFYHQKELKELAAAKYYTVRSGDTLGHIARRYGTSVSAICRLNGIRSTSIIRIGQRLRVR